MKKLFGILILSLAIVTIIFNIADHDDDFNINHFHVSLDYPANGEQVIIDRPSQKLSYRWNITSKMSVNRSLLDNFEYIVKVFSPTGELLINETTNQLDAFQRNFFLEGEYQWEVSPVWNGRVGRETRGHFFVKHPELNFKGTVKAPKKISGVINEDGSFTHDIESNSQITWLSQDSISENKYLVEVAKGDRFNSIVRRTFLNINQFEWNNFTPGEYFLRVSRISPFGSIKGVSPRVKINVSVRYPLPKIAKARSKNKLLKKVTKIPIQKTNKKQRRLQRRSASVRSKYNWKWSYLIPKEIVLSLGQGDIDFNQKSNSTDARSKFTLQNIFFETRFQEKSDMFVDVNFLTRTTNVQGMSDFSDSNLSLLAGREWRIGESSLRGFGAIGLKYNSLNFFEQSSATTIDSKQDQIFNATAQAGVIISVGEKFENKLRVVVDVGDLSQYGARYNGRLFLGKKKWFVDLSAGYFDGTYSVSDQFNEKTIDRSEAQLFMGVGRSFK